MLDEIAIDLHVFSSISLIWYPQSPVLNTTNETGCFEKLSNGATELMKLLLLNNMVLNTLLSIASYPRVPTSAIFSLYGALVTDD